VVECVVEVVHYRTTLEHIQAINYINVIRGCRGRDRMVVVFTTTYAIGAYHTNVVRSNPANDEVYSIQHYVKFVGDFRQISGFLRVLRFTPPIKLTATI